VRGCAPALARSGLLIQVDSPWHRLTLTQNAKVKAESTMLSSTNAECLSTKEQMAKEIRSFSTQVASIT
jgi:hypothetical protein